MTDLKRERALIDELYAGNKGLFYWNEEDTRRIARALAAARREGAEEMRERAARTVLAGSRGGIRGEIAAAIRALPLTSEEPT